MNKNEQTFKPLWRIHNKTYRQYVKGTYVIRLRKYTNRLLRVLKLKK